MTGSLNGNIFINTIYFKPRTCYMLHTIAGCGRRPDEVREVVQSPRHLREGGAAPHPRQAGPRLVLQLLDVVLCRYMQYLQYLHLQYPQYLQYIQYLQFYSSTVSIYRTLVATLASCLM